MEKLFFTFLLLSVLACEDSTTQTSNESSPNIINADLSQRLIVDSISQPLKVVMDDNPVLHKGGEIIELKQLNPYQNKSVIDSTIILIKRLGQRGRIGRSIDSLSIHVSRNGASTLVFNNKNNDLSIYKKEGKILGKKNMGEYDLDGEGASRYILREDGAGVLIYNHPQRVVDVYSYKEDGTLLLDQKISLPKNNLIWKFLSTATSKMYIYSSDKENNIAKIMVYDLSTGKKIKTKTFKNTVLGSLTISPKEYFIVSVDRRSSTIKIFNKQLELMNEFEVERPGYDPVFYEKNGTFKMVYFTWNNAYLYDLSKDKIAKIEVVKDGAVFSDLTFLNDSTLLYGLITFNTQNKYNNNTGIVESYLYTQGIGNEKYICLEENEIGGVKFSKENDKQFLLAKFLKKEGKIYEIIIKDHPTN